MTIPADNPITSAADDVLGRAGLAESFADDVLGFDVSEGAVVGVLGPWGSGKTSFLNLARARLDDHGVAVIDFNPWMFSGTEQLVVSFFVELSAQLKLRPGLASIGEDVEAYGETFAGLGWLPLVGVWIERGRGATKLLARLLQRRKEGITGRREKLRVTLRAVDKPIVVVLDDVDRLAAAEIREIFKLIRLTGNFPNVIYLVAFDRERVERALAEEHLPGREYLEKILQLGVDLPVVPQQVLIRQLLESIDRALADVDDPGPFDEQVWPDVLMEVVRPLVRNMRDVRHYVAALYGTVRSLGGQVALVDVLTLEAIRVFLPDVFRELGRSIDGLTHTASISYSGREDPRLKQQVDRLLDASGEHREVVASLIRQIFPAGSRHIGGTQYLSDWQRRWLRERRAAHEDVLRLYLERVVGETFGAFIDAEQAWSRLADRDALDQFLRSLDLERVEDVIAALEVYENEFTSEQVMPGVTVLLNLLPDLPERKRGMLQFGSLVVVARVVYRLLNALGDPATVEHAVEQILSKLRSLSAKLEVVSIVGHREGRGHQLVSEDAAARLERDWRAEVRAAPVDELVKEPELFRVLYLTKVEAEAPEPAFLPDPSPALTLAVLRTASSDARSQVIGSRAVRHSPRLAWEPLIDLYGDENTLRERIEALRQAQPEGTEELFALADRYLAGWRPDLHDD
jgi:hypothetical protein